MSNSNADNKYYGSHRRGKEEEKTIGMKRLRKDRGGSRVHLVVKRGIDNKKNE